MENFEVEPPEAAIGRRDFIKLGAGAGALMALDINGASARAKRANPSPSTSIPTGCRRLMTKPSLN